MEDRSLRGTEGAIDPIWPYPASSALEGLNRSTPSFDHLSRLLDWALSLSPTWGIPPLLDRFPLFAWTAGDHGRIEYLNRQAAGYLTGFGNGITWRKAVHPDDLPGARKAWRLALRDRREFRHEARLRRARDNTWRWHLCCARPSSAGAGESLWLGLALDIHDRKRTDAGFRDREALFLTAVRDASIGMAFLDLNGRFVEANPACCRLTGYGEEELRQLTFLSITHPEDRTAAQNLLEHLLGGRIPNFVIERRILRKPGDTVWVRSTVSMAWKANRQPWRILAFNEDISGQRRALAALREREDQLRYQLNLIPSITRFAAEAFYLLDANGYVTFMNPAAEEMFGWTREETQGRPLFDLLHAGASAHPDCTLRAVLSSGQTVRGYEDIFSHKDGRPIHVSCSNSPILRQGKVVASVLVVRDITAEKKVREERAVMLRRERRRGADLAGLARAAIAMNAAGTREEVLEAATSQARELLGAREAFVTNVSPHDNPGPAGFPTPYHYQVCQQNQPLRLSREQREGGWLAAPLKNRSGDNIGLIHITGKNEGEFTEGDEAILVQLAETASLALEKANLYTSLLATNEALAHNERQFRLLTEVMPQMVWTANEQGELDYFNLHWYEYTASNFEESGGQGWIRFLHPDDRDPLRDRWRHSLKTGTPLEAECRIINSNSGNYRWFLTRALAIHGAEGTVLRWFGTCTDIDDQKHTEDELRAANNDLSQFAYAASHDLREPLRMVIAYTQLMELRLRGKLDDETSAFCNQVVDSANRMNLLLRDLLAYTGIGRADEVPPRLTSMEAVLHDAIEILGADLLSTGTELTHDPLPAVWGNPGHFAQLLQNLIANAIKYRSAATPAHIHVSAQPAGAWWLFRIRDNGIGIPAEYHKKIFGLFKRLHGKEIAGTGIGLAICSKVVARYGGRIWVESEPGAGATFCFTLPRDA